MNLKSQNSKVDVFEMILHSTGNQSAQVKAQPSNLAVPENWHEEYQEGQLAVDVTQTEKDVIVISTMAGAITDKIEVYLHNDLLTIRGERFSPVNILETDYFHQECFWGKFSRTVILPLDVKGDLAKAEYNNGVLVIRIPKQKIDAKIPVIIVED